MKKKIISRDSDILIYIKNLKRHKFLNKVKRVIE
jgi:hypothetical protein